jgi:hypothetical protein
MGNKGNERKWKKVMKRNVRQFWSLDPHDNDHLGIIIINFYASKSGNFFKF